MRYIYITLINTLYSHNIEDNKPTTAYLYQMTYGAQFSVILSITLESTAMLPHYSFLPAHEYFNIYSVILVTSRSRQWLELLRY